MKNPRKNGPALSDRLLKLRFAEKNTDSGPIFGTKCRFFSRMSAGWPYLHDGFSRRSCTRTSKSDSLLKLDHAQLNRISRGITQIVLENLAPDRSLDVGKGTVLAAKHFPERSDVGLIPSRLKP